MCIVMCIKYIYYLYRNLAFMIYDFIHLKHYFIFSTPFSLSLSFSLSSPFSQLFSLFQKQFYFSLKIYFSLLLSLFLFFLFSRFSLSNKSLSLSFFLLKSLAPGPCLSQSKRFYNKESIPFIWISPLAESPFTLSWLAEILELGKGQSFVLYRREGGRVWKIFAAFRNSAWQLFLYIKFFFSFNHLHLYLTTILPLFSLSRYPLIFLSFT